VINLPNIKKADEFTIDCNGMRWTYLEDKEVLVVNKDGVRVIPFSDLSPEALEEITKSVTNDNTGIIFNDNNKKYSLDDLVRNKE